MKKSSVKKSNLELWLDKLESDIQNLLGIYAKACDASSAEYADHYFATACNAYLKIIQAIRPYAVKPLTLVKDMPSLLKGEHKLTETLDLEFNKIDSLFGLPRIFHPHYHSRNSCFVMSSDIKCYMLAKTLHDSITTLQETEGGIILAAIKKLAGQQLAEFLRILSDRIHRFEYNKNNKALIEFYDEDLIPRLLNIKKELSECNLTKETFSKLLTAFDECMVSTLDSPVCLAQFLRDDPVVLVAELAKHDTYPVALSHFISSSKSVFCTNAIKMAVTLYKEAVDACNEEVGCKVTNICSDIVVLLSTEDELRAECSSLVSQCVSRCNQLVKRNEEYNEKYNNKIDNQKWSESIAGQMSVLMVALEPFSKFNPSASHPILNFQPKKLKLNEICHELYNDLSTFSNILESRKHISGAALIAILNDVNTATISLVREAITVLEKCNVTDEPALDALRHFVTAMTPLLTFDQFVEEKEVDQSVMGWFK